LLIVRSASIARPSGVIVTGLGVIACASVVTAASMSSASVRSASRPVKMPLKRCWSSITSTEPGVTPHHAPAGMLHRLVRGQHKWLLVFDNVRELSVGHDASLSAGASSLNSRQ